MNMTLKRIDTGRGAADASARVFKRAALAEVRAARDLVGEARQEAQRLLEDSRATAAKELRVRQAELEAHLWQRCADYAAAVARDWEVALEAVERDMARVLGSALVQLVESAAPDERLRACVRQLLAQAGSPDAGVLQIAPQDEHSLAAMRERLPWPVRPSAELPPGTVRLVSSQGRWECDVEGALMRLLEAIGAPEHCPTGGKT